MDDLWNQQRSQGHLNVHYDPRNPDHSVLKVSINWILPAIVFALGLFLLLLGLAAGEGKKQAVQTMPKRTLRVACN